MAYAQHPHRITQQVDANDSPKVSVSHRILFTLGEIRSIAKRAYVVHLPDDVSRGDTSEEPGRSRLELLEDGVPLGPAHAPHSVVSDEGNGHYSHWGNELFFSTSDDSDPRTNGRVYQVLLPARGEDADDAVRGPKSLHLINHFVAYDGHAFSSHLPPGWPQGNTGEEPGRSRLKVLENGVPLGPAHAQHSDIVGAGGGQYSHWGDTLYLSTSDNSDPRTNGREYHVLDMSQNGADNVAWPQAPKALFSISHFGVQGGFGYSFRLPQQIPLGDGADDLSRSSLQVIEDGVPLGPAHAPHSDITEKGRGCFSHWGDTLFLSTSDNSDPRVNGRTYHALLLDYLDTAAIVGAAGGHVHRLQVRRTSQDHGWARLGLDAPPTGALGKNLSIVVRSREGSTPTNHRSMVSAAELVSFEGEIKFLPTDGSEVAETPSGDHSQTQVGCRPVKSGDAQALNSAIFECTRDWVLVIDDDVVLKPGLLEDLDSLTQASAISFFSVATVDPSGEMLLRDRLLAFPERSAIHFRLLTEDEASDLERPATRDAVVNALWTGPILMKKRTFAMVGGFDAELSNELGRLEFSLRLKQAGIPVMSAPISTVQSRSTSMPTIFRGDFDDVFNDPAFKGQRLHFENKHDAMTTALMPPEFATISRTYTEQFAHSPKSSSHHSQQRRVALVIDSDVWAFASISRQIIKHLSDVFEFIVIPSGCITNPAQVMLMCQDCDIIHFFFGRTVGWFNSGPFDHYCRGLGVDAKTFFGKILKDKFVTTGVYDHLFEEEGNDVLNFVLNEVCSAYYVSSDKLRKIYDIKPNLRQPTAVISDGVDLEQFFPRGLNRFDDARDRELVIGWVGNSLWRSEIEDVKGVHTLLNPAIKAAKARGVSLRPHYADRNSRYVPPSKMPEYYGEIDVLVCSSKVEGTPNPVLEAMASGVPVISTDVGIVADAFGPLQRRFLLPSRDVESMVRALEDLDANRHLLRELSRENLEHIRRWDWSVRAQAFRTFFSHVLAFSGPNEAG